MKCICFMTALAITGCAERSEEQFAADKTARVLQQFVDQVMADDVEGRAEASKNVVGPGQAIQVGQLKINFISVRRANPRITGSLHDDDAVADQSAMVFTLRVKNTSEGQVFAPRFYDPKATDTFGNELQTLTFGYGALVEGDESEKEIGPGESATLRMAFVPKPVEVKGWTVVVPLVTSNKKGLTRISLKVESGQVLSGK